MDKGEFFKAIHAKISELGGSLPKEESLDVLHQSVVWAPEDPRLDENAALRWCERNGAEIRFSRGPHPCVSIMRADGFLIGASASSLSEAIRVLKRRNTPWHPEKCPDCGGLCKLAGSFDPPKWARVGVIVRCKEGHDRDRVGRLLEVSPHSVYIGAPDFRLTVCSNAVSWDRWEPLHPGP